MTKRIVALAGDGIGPEIMTSALEILAVASKGKFAYEVVSFPFGGSAIEQVGIPLPQETLMACQQADAILLGAIGGPRWEGAKETPESGLLALRQALKLYANLRPTKMQTFLEEKSPLKADKVRGTDFVIVRELIGGLYFGQPKCYDSDEAIDTMNYTRKQIEQIVRLAFELALARRQKLTSVDKANVLANSKLWRQIVQEVSEEYPSVEVEHIYVDAAAMKLMMAAPTFDVIVTENLFGDILSDQASVITGSLGMLASASLSIDGPALYEPIHGSAPDIAGLNIANPVSMILSVCMMLRQSFQQIALADQIETATYETIAATGGTRDLGGQLMTSEFKQELIKRLE
ncbi:3-isopropylmalate dehydrogenase [Aerococcaceae bacterium DSM 109653]|uniref:3-isopropylmalate dehydrogenase n=1 Tax=Fundicoccus ignavus TaxID=2664442 RepID=A0A844BT68_9LACT|nr:3-isopropylmalate dehydrogenase [Fundicoccus ignavus]MRI81292.1 3-isopropylmalate dehydrogenase [Fundicoccus ignavus]